MIENRREIPVLEINFFHRKNSKELSEEYEQISGVDRKQTVKPGRSIYNTPPPKSKGVYKLLCPRLLGTNDNCMGHLFSSK